MGFKAISLEEGEDHSVGSHFQGFRYFSVPAPTLVTKNKVKLTRSPQDEKLQRGISKLLLPPTPSLAHPDR